MNKLNLEEIMGQCLDEVIEEVLKDLRETNAEYKHTQKELSRLSVEINRILFSLSEADRDIFEEFNALEGQGHYLAYHSLITFDKRILAEMIGL